MAKVTPKQLYRSEKNRVIAGVCGGLADYFNLDPVIVRIFAVLIALFGGSGVLLYLILWIVIPSETNDGKKLEINNNSYMWAGVIFVGLGLIFLFNNFGIFRFLDIGRLWPILLVVLGLVILNRSK
jgi:phage shock protein C